MKIIFTLLAINYLLPIAFIAIQYGSKRIMMLMTGGSSGIKNASFRDIHAVFVKRNKN